MGRVRGDMAEPPTNGNAQGNGTSLIVSVSPRGSTGARRATILDTTDSAVRVVESLIEAGCDTARVQAFSGREVRVGIEFNPTVALYDTDGAIIAAALAGAATPPVITPASAPFEREPEPAEALPAGATARNLHLRMDRIVFASLWIASLVILLASLAVSISLPQPPAFVPAAHT